MIERETKSSDRESFAKTSAILREFVEKAGHIILWDACKMLGWSINKGAKVSSKMAGTGYIFITTRMRNGRAIRVLSMKPLPFDDWTP
ncbi:MAG: hypothetical protein GYA24_22935 [Candidatus Lokiarchaeota archaeon]|nr:hypothetical protein [Candidatus Lokiarchaeota archaeon]